MKSNGFLIGNGTGKLGNVVGYVVAGQQLFRSYQPVVIVSQNQVSRDQRWGVFKPAVAFISLLKYYDRDLYVTSPSGRTRYAQMLKDVFPAFGGTESSPTVDLTLATIGNGGIPMQDWLTVAKNSTDKIDLTWEVSTPVPSMLATDKAFVMLTSATKDLVVIVDCAATRADGTAVVTVPVSMEGTVVTVSSILWYAATGGNETASKIRIKGAIGTVNLA
jgi:hypothetical protein